MADNYNGIIDIDDGGSGAVIERTYTKIFGHVYDENYNPLVIPAGGTPIVLTCNNEEYTLGNDGYFEFDSEEIIKLSSGTISVFDGNENSIYNAASASYAFSSLAKTRLNIIILVPYKRINQGDITTDQLIDINATITITNGAELASRLNITAKAAADEGNTDGEDVSDFQYTLNGNTISCVLKYGYIVTFVDPDNEYYIYNLIINETGKNNFTVSLARIPEKHTININVIVYDVDTSENITNICYITIDDEQHGRGEHVFETYKYATVIAESDDYISGYVIVEASGDVIFHLKNQGSSSSIDDEWYRPEIAIPWYTNKIDLKYNTIDIYSSNIEPFINEKINISGITDTSCTGEKQASVVLTDKNVRPNRNVNELFYSHNTEINDNLYKFTFELLKEAYPVDYVKGDNLTKTLELHTFNPVNIKIQQRKDTEGGVYNYTDENIDITNCLTTTYNGSEKEDATGIISMKAMGYENPWNIVGLTSNSTVSLDNVYISPVIPNISGNDAQGFPYSEKLEYIDRLSIIYNNVICHSESYVFPVSDNTVPVGDPEFSPKTLEFIYGKKYSNISISPVKYLFTQDDESSIYTIEAARNITYIPKLTIDNIDIDDNPFVSFDGYDTKGSQLKINTTAPIYASSDGNLTVKYHMNEDDENGNSFDVPFTVRSAPEITLTGYIFDNTAINKKFQNTSDNITISEAYFDGAGGSVNLSNYNFTLYTKNVSSTPQSDVTVSLEGVQDNSSFYNGGLKYQIKNISLTSDSNSTIEYNLIESLSTDVNNLSSWTIYSNKFTSYNDIIAVRHKNGNVVSLNKYSYINAYVPNEDLTYSYIINNNPEDIIYDVYDENKYGGKYYLYSDSELVSNATITQRWQWLTYLFKSDIILSNTLIVPYTVGYEKSIIAGLYNIMSDGTTYMPNNPANDNILLWKDENTELLQDKNTLMQIKESMSASLNHSWILNMKNDGSNYNSTMLYTTLSNLNGDIYIGPGFTKSSENKYTIKYTNYQNNSALTQSINLLIDSLADSPDNTGGEYITNGTYDYTFDSQEIPQSIIDRYWELYSANPSVLTYNRLNSISGGGSNSLIQYYENNIYKYDLLKFGENTYNYYQTGGSFSIYNGTSDVQYNNFEDYVNTYVNDTEWKTTVGYTVAKSFILGFAYSYTYNSIIRSNNNAANPYNVGRIDLSNTKLYSYTVTGNNISSSENHTINTTYTQLLNHSTEPADINNGIELFKVGSNLIEDVELLFYNDYNNEILNALNAAFIYNNSSDAITKEQMFNNIFNNGKNVIISSAHSDANLIDYISLDNICREYNLKLKGDNINYSSQIINYAFAAKNAILTFYPKLQSNVVYHKAVTSSSTITSYTRVGNSDTLTIIKNHLDMYQFSNERYYWKVGSSYYPMGYKLDTVTDPETNVTSDVKRYAYNNGDIQIINAPDGTLNESDRNNIYLKSSSSSESTSYSDDIINLSNENFGTLFIIFRSYNPNQTYTNDIQIDLNTAANYNIAGTICTLLRIESLKSGEYIKFDKDIYNIYNTYKAIFEEGLRTQYDDNNPNKYKQYVLNYVKNLSGDDTNGYTTSSDANGYDIYLHNYLLYGIAHQCYNLIKDAGTVFDNYKKTVKASSDMLDTNRTNYLRKLLNTTSNNLQFSYISSFNAISYIDNTNSGISKYKDVYEEINYLNNYGPQIMITNYLKRAAAYTKADSANTDQYKQLFRNQITKDIILDEINYVNKWLTSRLYNYGKTTDDLIQWGNGTKLAFNKSWLNLITDNEYSVNTIYCNGYNIFKLSNDVYTNENIIEGEYAGLHLRYIINTSPYEITKNTDVYSRTVYKWRGTLRKDYDYLTGETKYIHFLLYWHDGFIKELKVANNALKQAYLVNNIDCTYDIADNKLLLVFDASQINYDYIDTSILNPSIELQYCKGGDNEYTSIEISNNNGFYYELNIESYKLYHINYRMKWSSATGITVYSESKNLVIYYDPENDGYDYKAQHFNINEFENVNKNYLATAVEAQLFAYKQLLQENTSYYVAEFSSGSSNSIVFKLIQKVNSVDAVVSPQLISDYPNYNLTIVQRTSGGLNNNEINYPGSEGGTISFNRIRTTNTKYILTKILNSNSNE